MKPPLIFRSDSLQRCFWRKLPPHWRRPSVTSQAWNFTNPLRQVLWPQSLYLIICCHQSSAAPRTLLPKQIPFLELHFLNLDGWRQNSAWQRNRQLHIGEWLESLSSEQELEGCLPLWKGMVATKRPAQNLHLAGHPLGRGGSFVCVNPRLLSAHPKLSLFPWAHWVMPTQRPFWPLELLPVALPCFCLHVLINPSHLLFIKCNHKGTT